MRLRKVTSALMAAGIGAGLAVGYMHFDASAVGTAEAATRQVATSAALPTPIRRNARRTPRTR